MHKEIFSLLDLTSLNVNDTPASIKNLCEEAVTSRGNVAAVCVYPAFVTIAAMQLKRAIPVAAVANFPHGTDNIEDIIATIKTAIAAGAREIDVVFPYHQYLSGDVVGALQVIRDCKAACGDVILKVILETGALELPDIIADVSAKVIAAGADFLKTSTGKIVVGATIDAAVVMLQAIKNAGKPVGLKVSGGIRTVAQAENYIALAEDIMGVNWVCPKRFRIGASKILSEPRP